MNWLKQHFPLCLKQINFPSKLKVWVFAPHPDDFDAVAVTLKMLFDHGANIILTVASSGFSGVEDAFCSPPGRERKAAVRESEQLASCALFGLPANNVRFLRLEEDDSGKILDNAKNYQTALTQFELIRPDLVFLPHGNDTNSDHRIIFSILEKIARETEKPFAAFLNRDPKTIALREDVFTIFGQKLAEWKAALLRCHKSQHQRNLNTRGYGFDERILREDRQNAQRAPATGEFAEVFEIIFRPE
ncbi:MAG: PIG-L family deacetylase [Victivallaceae bacterium]